MRITTDTPGTQRLGSPVQGSEIFGQHRPIPVVIAPVGRKIEALTNADLEEILLKEDLKRTI